MVASLQGFSRRSCSCKLLVLVALMVVSNLRLSTDINHQSAFTLVFNQRFRRMDWGETGCSVPPQCTPTSEDETQTSVLCVIQLWALNVRRVYHRGTWNYVVGEVPQRAQIWVYKDLAPGRGKVSSEMIGSESPKLRISSIQQLRKLFVSSHIAHKCWKNILRNKLPPSRPKNYLTQNFVFADETPKLPKHQHNGYHLSHMRAHRLTRFF